LISWGQNKKEFTLKIRVMKKVDTVSIGLDSVVVIVKKPKNKTNIQYISDTSGNVSPFNIEKVAFEVICTKVGFDTMTISVEFKNIKWPSYTHITTNKGLLILENTESGGYMPIYINPSPSSLPSLQEKSGVRIVPHKEN
ncbi:MAG TPA: hypothetical protein VK890_05185, partial [Bacteroidia bacterium]|nr:hypothetical protein [Bacteroidia bacterium]